MKWHIHETCGNSPKNQMLIDWIQAFFDQNKPLLFIDESSVFIFNDEIQPFASIDPPTNLEKIQIKKAITHGKVGRSWVKRWPIMKSILSLYFLNSL
ncbi:MAG TPA: hypothetical protein VFC62_03260 [Atopostipes sp.]|nr:hypothetical protein [Atopostipes sp.]